MQRTRSPRTRCAVCLKNGIPIMFVIIPRPPRHATPAPTEPEMLMFFENLAPHTETQESATTTGVGAGKWAGGSVVVPVVVTGGGELERCGALPKTNFVDFKEVYDMCGPFESVVEYPAVFGCILLDKMYFLVATRVTEVSGLPFGGAIFRVEETEWVPFRIPGAASLRIASADKNRLREFQRYSFRKGYFFSDDYDLTYPFPFSPPPHGEAPEFHCDWSEHIRQPFRPPDLCGGCSALIRGFAEGDVMRLNDGSNLHVLLLGRQNNLNPGPRYLGRGLNAANAAGNDHIYEYVMWKENSDGSVCFARHTILRGTIPVRWSTQINTTISEPSMVFSRNREDVLRGSDAYFEFVFRQLSTLIQYDAGDTSVAACPAVRCINLLRQNPQSGEETLGRYFLEAIRRSDVAVRRLFPSSHLDLTHIDWLGLVKEWGIDVATTTLWEAVLSFFTSDTDSALATVGLVHPTGVVIPCVWQNRFVRVNCADSLDRTNLACFLTCFQVSIFMLGSLGITFDSFADQRPLPPLGAHEPSTRSGFPEFSDSATGTKRMYPKPFVSSWCEARNPSLYPVAVGRVLSELYIHNGDIVAQLYTGSAAMHGNLLRAICGSRPAASNMVIATQRRFENVFEDRQKFRNIELLLCRNKDIHFPSMSQVFLTRPVPLTHWSCALIAVGVPKSVTSLELERTIRKAWDDMVLPTLLPENGLLPMPGDALRFAISEREDEVKHHDEFVSALSQILFEQTPPVEKESCLPCESEQVIVIEFDHVMCGIIDAPRLLRERVSLKVQSSTVHLAPYEYPTQDTDRDESGLFQKAASSLRSGLKNFVRGLNA